MDITPVMVHLTLCSLGLLIALWWLFHNVNADVKRLHSQLTFQTDSAKDAQVVLLEAQLQETQSQLAACQDELTEANGIVGRQSLEIQELRYMLAQRSHAVDAVKEALDRKT